MSNLQLFNYEENNIRVVMIDDEPWFVARDFSEILEYSATSKMLRLIDEEDKQEINPQDYAEMVQSLPANSFRLAVINESGVYNAIFNSTKPEAKKFKRWVISEVLPTIRRTGNFSISAASQMDRILDFVEKQSIINTKLLEDSNSLTKINNKGNKHPGCYNILTTDTDDVEYTITAQQYLVSKGLVNWTKRNTFSKRAAQALRVGKHLEVLPMNNKCNVLYSSEDIVYLDETLSQMLNLN